MSFGFMRRHGPRGNSHRTARTWSASMSSPAAPPTPRRCWTLPAVKPRPGPPPPRPGRTGPGRGPNLADEVEHLLLPTPKASDGEGGGAEFGEGFVQRVVADVVGLEGLKAGMELEATYAVFGDQASGASDRGLSGVRVDRAEGMRTSGCAAAWSAISSLDRAGWPVAAVASTVNTTAAMCRAR